MSNINGPIITTDRLAEFQDLVEKYFVRKYDMQQILTEFVDKPYLRSILRDHYANRAWVAQKILDECVHPHDLIPYATQEWVKETLGPLIEPDKYAKLEYVDSRFDNLVEDQDLAKRDWVRGKIDSFMVDLAEYATKDWVKDIVETSEHNHHEGLATQEWVEGRLKNIEEGQDYATRAWVQGLLDSLKGSGYASRDWVMEQINEIEQTHTYATADDVRNLFRGELEGYAYASDEDVRALFES